MTEKWRPDPTGPPLPEEFDQMRQVAVLPLGPDWFERQGVPMKEAEIEDGWTLLHGTIKTGAGTFVVIGAPGDDAVGLWADKRLAPQAAVDALEAAMEHGAGATVFDATQLSQ
jgi:hypothetical protein